MDRPVEIQKAMNVVRTCQHKLTALSEMFDSIGDNEIQDPCAFSEGVAAICGEMAEQLSEAFAIIESATGGLSAAV